MYKMTKDKQHLEAPNVSPESILTWPHINIFLKDFRLRFTFLHLPSEHQKIWVNMRRI